mmetsp:Transcript_8374/g.14359  ORF Transcript_8374/g.14359 Transcript_8374/m.14359 type:complete len:233 (+) Transcript_8374:398-1096(+)
MSWSDSNSPAFPSHASECLQYDWRKKHGGRILQKKTACGKILVRQKAWPADTGNPGLSPSRLLRPKRVLLRPKRRLLRPKRRLEGLASNTKLVQPQSQLVAATMATEWNGAHLSLCFSSVSSREAEQNHPPRARCDSDSDSGHLSASATLLRRPELIPTDAVGITAPDVLRLPVPLRLVLVLAVLFGRVVVQLRRREPSVPAHLCGGSGGESVDNVVGRGPSGHLVRLVQVA